MENIYPLLLILLFALFFKLYLKLKIEEALLFSIAIIIIILTVFGTFGLMHIGQYLIYSLVTGSLVFSIVYIIKQRGKYDYSSIFTPGLCIIVLSYVIYAIITKNNVLYIWDEARCYGTAAHYMHITNTISDGGSITVLSYFFTRLIGYSEHSLFVSKWLFSWVCLALPLSKVKWEKWYMAAIYSILAFGVITIIDPEPSYLMDAPAGLIAGAGIAYLSVLRNKSRFSVIMLICTLALTIKDNVGLVLLAFMALFFLAYYCVELSNKEWQLTKKEILKIFVYIAFMIIVLAFKQLFMSVTLNNTFDTLKETLGLIIISSALLVLFAASWLIWLNKTYIKLAERVKKSPVAKKMVHISAAFLASFLLFSIIYKAIWKILAYSKPFRFCNDSRLWIGYRVFIY